MDYKMQYRIGKLGLICTIFIVLTAILMVKTIDVNQSTALAQADSFETEDTEYIEYLIANDIEIPEEYFGDRTRLNNIIKEIIDLVQADSSCAFPYSDDKLLNFAEDIRNLIIDKDKNSSSSNVSARLSNVFQSNYTLQDSTLVSNSGSLNYNCYAYAIDRTENPPQYITSKQYQPGDFSGDDFNMDMSIEQMANVVKSDLYALGYNNVFVYNSLPATQFWQQLICIRKGDFDYHFMKYEFSTQEWYHKPGFTAILKYNYAPSNDRIWTNESVDRNGNAYAPTITYDSDIYYITYNVAIESTVLTSSTVRITGVNPTISAVGALTVPSTINGRTVTEIGNAAFANQGSLTSVTIPESITSIGANAFENCSSVEEMSITSSSQLTSIGNSAFRGCSSLFGIWIPEGVTSIGANTFENCTGLSVFWGGTSLTDIGNSAFRNCSSLFSVNLYRTITVIGYNAFENCVSLDLNKLPTSLERIENAAFAGCTGLENMNLPIGLEHIGYDAFNSCSGLQTVLIPDTVTSIGGNAFANCSYLTVYTNCQSVSSGWVSNWNPSGRPVVLGGNLETEDNYVMSITNTGVNVLNENAPNGINDPYRNGYTFDGWYTSSDFSGTGYSSISEAPNGELYAKWTAEDACVAEGSLITLADGTQKAVEELTGNEMLLVWDLFNGTFSAAPILFIDSDPMRAYEVITLTFADGTEVKVIDEHGFWNVDLNEYVFLRADAAKYIGDKFNKQTVDANGNMTYTAVELVGVSISTEYTTAWSPVTYGHLCYYVNGMLSMPGATTGLINIFEVDPDTMKIDEEAYAEDIAEYGVYTYEEFTEEIAEVPETIFNAFGGAYLKVAIGKGILTADMILELISRYSEFFD